MQHKKIHLGPDMCLNIGGAGSVSFEMELGVIDEFAKGAFKMYKMNDENYRSVLKEVGYDTVPSKELHPEALEKLDPKVYDMIDHISKRIASQLSSVMNNYVKKKTDIEVIQNDFLEVEEGRATLYLPGVGHIHLEREQRDELVDKLMKPMVVAYDADEDKTTIIKDPAKTFGEKYTHWDKSKSRKK